MKRALKNVMFSIVAFGVNSAVAGYFDDIGPIIGIDYKITSASNTNLILPHPVIPNLGHALPKSYNGASVYLGSRFSENFGLELGYDWTNKKSRTSTTVKQEQLLALSIDSHMTNRFSQWRLDLNGYLPFACEGFNLIGSVGMGLVRSTGSSAFDSIITEDGIIIDRQNQNFPTRGRKVIFRWGLGAQYMMNCNFGIRGMYRYECLSSLRTRYALINHGNRSFRIANNASVFTLGLFYKFY